VHPAFIKNTVQYFSGTVPYVFIINRCVEALVDWQGVRTIETLI